MIKGVFNKNSLVPFILYALFTKCQVSLHFLKPEDTNKKRKNGRKYEEKNLQSMN